MARVCEAALCHYPVFGTDKITRKGYCQVHQYLRTDKKPKEQKRTEIKRTPLKKTIKPTGERAVFETIWNTRPHTSFISGIEVPGAPSNFAHVLPKGRFPHFRLKLENIVLLTAEEHFILDQGSEEQREEYAYNKQQEGITVNWKKLYELRNELRNQYQTGAGK